MNWGFEKMKSEDGDAIAICSKRFPNCLVAYLGDQDSPPPQNPRCQENMKQKMNIEGRKESIPSLHSIPSIQHSMNVKESSKSINIYDTNTHISDSEDRSQENSSIRSLGLSNQKIESQENSDMGGSLNLLVDAIRLLEGQELHKTIGRQIHKMVSIQVLPKKMLRRLKNDLGKLSLQNHQCLVEDHGLESRKKMAFNKVIQSGDGQHSFSSISKVGEIEQGTMSFSRTKRGRLQAFPSKYSDSVLQPWKKISRRVQT